MLAEHVIEEGISSILYTEGKGNAWWIFNTLLAHLDEPLVVLTCDNLVTLDLDKLYLDYYRLGAPACMVVPVRPVEGLDGDYIVHESQMVTRIDRYRPAPVYCSGIQVLHPSRVRQLVSPVDDFYDVWDQLIARRQLYCSTVIPESWIAIDTLDALALAEALEEKLQGLRPVSI